MNGFVQKDKVQQDEELIAKAMYPKREEFQWRPAPILCKRFDLIDPYMGKVILSWLKNLMLIISYKW